MVKKVMIIDDDSNILRLYEEFLEENGFEVRSVNDPKVVLDEFNAFMPDLVLLDINMPEKDGFTLIREIKVKNPKIPVFFLTAYDEHKRNFNSLYAEEFIPKSKEPKILLKLIQDMSEKKN
ncbi:MAG: response regulator [Deferribacterales bacterium]